MIQYSTTVSVSGKLRNLYLIHKFKAAVVYYYQVHEGPSQPQCRVCHKVLPLTTTHSNAQHQPRYKWNLEIARNHKFIGETLHNGDEFMRCCHGRWRILRHVSVHPSDWLAHRPAINDTVHQRVCVTSTSSVSTVDRVNMGSEHGTKPQLYQRISTSSSQTQLNYVLIKHRSVCCQQLIYIQ